MGGDEEVGRFWARRWRVPHGLPRVAEVPERPPGTLHLLHHANGRTLAVYDPRRGRAEAVCELADAEYMRDPRVQGRYLPLRSGVLAYYRDAEGRRIVQHRRRRIEVPPGARVRVPRIGPWRALVVRHGGATRSLRVLDSPRRWEGPVWLRAWDFTWTEPDDFDLVLAIRAAANGDTADWV